MINFVTCMQEYARLPSKYEAFISNKTEWIKDKYFTQQRLAGTNPMSIQRVTIHGQGRNASWVLTAVTEFYLVSQGSIRAFGTTK